MNKTLLERMKESKDKHGVAFIGVFNDGKVRIDENYTAERIQYADESFAFNHIDEVMYDINESFAREYKFDSMKLGLSLVLLFDGKYADENQKLSEDAEPVDNIVRYYTMGASCYLDGEKTNKIDYGQIRSRQGFINYDRLVNSAEENGLSFNGPRTFEEFKEMILQGEPFDISLGAVLSDEKEQQQAQVQDEEIQQVEKPKSFLKKLIGR